MEFEIFEYKEEYGPVNWQEGFQKELEGKSLEEQLRCYAWTGSHFIASQMPYQAIEDSCVNTDAYSTPTPVDENSIIVKDGLIVGIVMKKGAINLDTMEAYYKYEYILPYQSCCYDSSSDNNGAGYKERNWYKYLICLPAGHSLWER